MGKVSARKPNRIMIAGEPYVPTVFLIHTRNPDGSPAVMVRIAADASVAPAGGEEFMIAYAPESMVGAG